MITIKFNRDPVTGKPEGMTAKQWQDQMKVRQTKVFPRRLKIEMARVNRKLASKPQYRGGFTKLKGESWTKQP